MATQVDNLYICPYNKSHMVEWHKLPNHLVRCRKNNPKLAESIKICPYNRCHHVPEEEMERHFANCEEYHTFQALSLKPASHTQAQKSGPQPSSSSHSKSFMEQVEHLEYNLHRHNFTQPPTSSGDDPQYAESQKQRNLDDLDEWFVD